MSCQPYADAIVDSAAVAPADLPQHLATCGDCRALAVGHRAALKLNGARLPLRRSVYVMPRLALVASAVVLVVGLAVVRGGSTRGPEAELPLTRSQPASTEDWAALSALHQQTFGYARADPDALGSFHDVEQYFTLERLSSRVEALSGSSTGTSKESP